VKLDAAGGSLIYATFFGANAQTDPAGVAVDANENAYVTGRTFADNVPSLRERRLLLATWQATAFS
jgi:hypothetical protein